VFGFERPSPMDSERKMLGYYAMVVDDFRIGLDPNPNDEGLICG